MSIKRALEHQEHAYMISRAKKFGRGLLLMLATVLSFAALGLLMTDRLFQPERFEIKQLKISGKFIYTSPEQIEAQVKKQELANFFAVDLNAIRAKVQALPWVARAEVRRHWPDTLSIQISEHRPVMQWQDNKQKSNDHHLWVSTHGEVIEVPDRLTRQSIKLVGNRANALSLMQMAVRWRRELSIYDLELLELSQSETQSLSVRMRLGEQGESFDLLLGTREVEARLARFQYLFDKQFRFSDFQLERVDARYPNGLAVQHTRRTESEPEPATI